MSDEQHQEVSNILQVSNKKPRVMSDTTAVVPYKGMPQQQENVVPIPVVQQEPVPAVPVIPLQQDNVSLEPVQSMPFGLPAMYITGCSVVNIYNR